MWYRLFKYVLIGPALRLATRPRVVGLEHIPDVGPCVIAANHLAVVDSLILCLVIPRRLTFVAKREYFERAGLMGAVQRWFFRVAGQIPIDRTGADAAQGALNTAARVLSDGGAWAIHPEGTRSRDGIARRARTGAVRVARETGAPIVPVGIRGTAALNPPGTRRFRPGRVDVVIGRPLVRQPNATVREETDALMEAIVVLAGQAYIDVYA
ncbi:MAG: lysophospholipid acyltransferase family protein [Gordonia sp. (in: high G+C Gram-positive bacteria)]|uniref:lysophospholipid acyltransferase family protein n=1 Tax=Gordonia sp. (in: high G+C Gram-positive bacteria) TaxID=84139 RepID=UPI0039E22BE0